jgi:hypothetical protein
MFRNIYNGYIDKCQYGWIICILYFTNILSRPLYSIPSPTTTSLQKGLYRPSWLGLGLELQIHPCPLSRSRSMPKDPNPCFPMNCSVADVAVVVVGVAPVPVLAHPKHLGPSANFPIHSLAVTAPVSVQSVEVAQKK